MSPNLYIVQQLT
jgi:sedoheptulose-bisphosphatase